MMDNCQSNTEKFIEAVNIKPNEDNVLSNFSVIRQKFENKSKRKPSTRTVSSSPPPAVSDFQRMYPNFKVQFTKRQFAAVEKCFTKADKNQDGYLEPKEIKTLMEEYEQSINLCDAEVIVSMGDHDEDGKLSPKEFVELCKPTAEVLREQQHMEGTHPISDKEFLELLVQKLRSFISPVNVKVKGTLKYFEKMISTGDKKEPVHKTPLTIKPNKTLLSNCEESDGQKTRTNFDKDFRTSSSSSRHVTGCTHPENFEKKSSNSHAPFNRPNIVNSIESSDIKGAQQGNLDFDLILIGSCFSSPAVIAALKARDLGKRVALVRVNVNQISDHLDGRMWRNIETEKSAKLLVHYAAMTGTFIGIKSAFAFGWTGKDGNPILDVQHDWLALSERIQEFLKSENEMQVMQWKTQNCLFSSKWYKILDGNTVEFELHNREIKRITGSVILCDTIEEAVYPSKVSGAIGNCVTFMQMLYQGIHPKKVLVIGGDAEAVESVGILASLHCDVTLCPMEGGLLGKYDKDMVAIIRKMLLEHEQDVKILDGWEPRSIQVLNGPTDGSKPIYSVTFNHSGSKTSCDFNCVIVNSRDFCQAGTMQFKKLELDNVFELVKQVQDNPENGLNTSKLVADILAVVLPSVDVIHPNMKPSVMAFSNYEYGWVGLTEDEAGKQFGVDNIRVCHSFTPTPEWALSRNVRCLASAKFICLTSKSDQIIGLHIIAPNARELIQGYALAIQLGATKQHLDKLEYIPGTCAKILSESKGVL